MRKVADTEYTEWQRPLSGVHSIMTKKSAQAGEGGGCTPTTVHYTYHHVQSFGVRWRADTLPLFLLYPLYVLYGGRGLGSVLV